MPLLYLYKQKPVQRAIDMEKSFLSCAARCLQVWFVLVSDNRRLVCGPQEEQYSGAGVRVFDFA